MTRFARPCPLSDARARQVNKGKLWDSNQVDEGLPEVWVDLNRD
jgi:hypothetical protein